MPARAQVGARRDGCQVFFRHAQLGILALAKCLRPGYERQMKLLRLLLLASLVWSAATAARADLTIVQKIEGSDGTNKITLKVKGDKARVEINPQITTILDAKSGDLTTLLHDQKKVMRISGERAKAMTEMAQGLAKENAPENAKPVATGKKEKINGYETEEYVADSPKYHTSYWVAKDYPNYQSILQQMSVLQSGAFAAIRKGMPDYHDLPGLPLRTDIKMDGKVITSTLESVSSDPVSDSAFAIPSDYTEMKMPDFLNGNKPPPTQPGQE